jgi:hypothetical protein
MSNAPHTLIDLPADPVKGVKRKTPLQQRSRSADELVREIEDTMGQSWLPNIYHDRILNSRTRSYMFPSTGKRSAPEIQHTLLGIELKIGRRRMLCPDLATARYLAVFARVGSDAVAIPYDITRISHLADELESSWHRMLLLAEGTAGDRSEAFAARVRRLLIGKVREAITLAGAGARIPEFKQNTRQIDGPQKSRRENE